MNRQPHPFIVGLPTLIVLSLVALISSATAAESKPIRALLVIGGCCHDYKNQKKILTEGISARANVEWTIVHEGDGSTMHEMSLYKDPDWAKGYDVVVHDECCSDVKDQAFVEGILKPHRAGLPAVNLHCAMHCYRVSFENFPDWFAFTGLDTRSHGPQAPIALDFGEANHPIVKGATNWTTIQEELYNNLRVWETVTPLVYGKQGRDNNVVAWVNDYRGTRVFSTTLGHNNETVGDPRYLDLVTRGLLWAVDKLNPDYLTPSKRVLSSSASAGNKTLAPVDLALNKPATASGSQPGHDPAHAVDGDEDTRWCAPDNGNGYWWQVDLQKPQDIMGCRINWEQDGKSYQYRIDVSEDGNSWKAWVDETKSGPRPQEDIHKLPETAVRFVRITVTKAPPGSWASFLDFEVFGKEMVEKSAGRVPDSRLAGVKVPPGFDAAIYAAPPDISYPTCLSATPTGEVFVGVDQNGSLDTQPNRGWVVRCRDTDGDGVADKFNVFAKMDSPRGIVFDSGTLYVMHPPVVEAYHDDDGDGVADRSEILVRGLANDLKFRGADHTCNGMRLGIDGWLYIALGDYGALKAVAKDGSTLQVHGGGIVRVRPDGSDLELVVQGTRNIYDVAIDPLMNIFTCDNTNDGDDWNLRLSHMIPTARYGYPSLFRNFSDEMIPTMADYGGGSPTGALFLDEPGFPGGFGRGLYTCQWGWNTVARHPLEADGASFKTPKEKDTFISIPRPTGIDADGEGNVYVASWKGATFNYAGPDVGYVLRVTPAGNHPTPFPDLKKATDEQLLVYLGSPSAVWRLSIQREILRRENKSMFVPGLEKIALNHDNLAVRVAAIFTLAQLPAADSREALLRITAGDQVREFALRAIADQKGAATAAPVKAFVDALPVKAFVDALGDRNPRVRLQAITALNRINRRELAEAILPLAADSDPSVAHVAFRTLVSLDATDACFKALERPDPALVAAAMRVLRNLHEPQVVDGLIDRLNRGEMSAARRLTFEALCRLYYREADWDGSWWGTRPDTSGPYFKAVTWEQSDKIGQIIRQTLASTDAETLGFTLRELQKHKIDFPALTPLLLTIAAQQPRLRPTVIDLFAGRTSPSGEVVAFLESTALSPDEDAASRARAFNGLERATEQPEASAAAVRVLLSLTTSESASPLSKRLRDAYVQDGRRARNVAFFEKLSGSANLAESALGYGVLLQIAGNKSAPKQAKATAQHAIEEAWKSAVPVSLLRAVGDVRAIAYADQVRARMRDSNPDVARAAIDANARLSPNPNVAGNGDRSHVVGKLSYEQTVQEVTKDPGDPKLGAQVFDIAGCVKCHTTSKSEPLKGPFLGDIAARYSRLEILDSILRPNAQIAQGFVTNWIETKDGTEYEGFIVRDAGDEIEMRNLAGASVISKKDIAKRGTRTTSIMPEGLVDPLTPEELASLLGYLGSFNAL